MTTMPLSLSPAECLALELLRRNAEANPVNLRQLMESYGEDFAARHRAWLAQNTIVLPQGLTVIFCRELGQPCGDCHHLAVSVAEPDALPAPPVVWQLAEMFGFADSFDTCCCWFEDPLEDVVSGKVLNVIQPLFIAEQEAAKIVRH